MDKKDFFFTLPPHLIAQTPISRRDNSRLLCIDRKTGSLEHKHFYNLPGILRSGDCLVLNNSRVMKARLFGTREGGGIVEVLLLKKISNARTVPAFKTDTYECLVRPGKKVKTNSIITFGNGELTATVNRTLPSGNREIEFHYTGNFTEILNNLGQPPLPPYIKEELNDPERYQTIYSQTPGSAAAPTAGLHFTKELLSEIESAGIKICYLTLHVGLGTFRPVKTDKIEEHTMHSEYFEILPQTAELINKTKETGGRIIAVGTTSCRTLESVAGDNGTISATSGETDIFIYPGYEFKCIDGLITNFHLPESTLIMLVSAFAGRERILNAYNEAIAEEYRFYSFGDAMLII